jgi:uncharacterized protein (DUF952 family)
MPTLYRIVSASDWESAQKQKIFQGNADDHRDGFIHLSSADQVRDTAARHYAGRADLLLLYLRSEALVHPQGALRWEVSRGGAAFPHWYAPLPLDLVHRVEPLPLGADGQHVFPDLQR